MECGLILLITCIIAGGTLGALLRGWGIVVRVLRLEETVDKQSARVTSLEKSKAANVKWAKKDQDQAELLAMQAASQRPKEPWEY